MSMYAYPILCFFATLLFISIRLAYKLLKENWPPSEFTIMGIALGAIHWWLMILFIIERLYK